MGRVSPIQLVPGIISMETRPAITITRGLKTILAVIFPATVILAGFRTFLQVTTPASLIQPAVKIISAVLLQAIKIPVVGQIHILVTRLGMKTHPGPETL